MNIHTRLGCCILSLWASLAVLAGCSGSQTPSALPATPQDAAGNGATSNGRPLTLPAKTGNLIYVAASTPCSLQVGSACRGEVSVYTYPKGEYQDKWLDGTTSRIRSVAGGECADNVGNVFVTYQSTVGQILEFVHGGTTPTAILTDPYGKPSACAVDPTTGNLAVTSTSDGGNSGSLLIYQRGSRTPIARAGQIGIDRIFTSVGYDDKGNAFVDGPGGLAELPRAGGSFINIKLDRPISSFGSVQWDGKQMTVADFGAKVIYRFGTYGSAASGVFGKVTGSTSLANSFGSWLFTQTWIEGNKVTAAALGPGACIVTCPGSVTIWHYPEGGAPIKAISDSGEFSNPKGVTVSRGLDPPK